MREVEMVKRLGVRRDAVREVRRRNAAEGVHWRRDGRHVVWTDEGVSLVGTVLGVGECEKRALRQAEAAEDEKEGLVAVVRRLPLNRRLVLGEVDGRPARVRVRSNENFIPGMVLRVRHVGEDLFEMEGRCPRFRGRW